MALFVELSDKGGQAEILNSWVGDRGNNKFEESGDAEWFLWSPLLAEEFLIDVPELEGD